MVLFELVILLLVLAWVSGGSVCGNGDVGGNFVSRLVVGCTVNGN